MNFRKKKYAKQIIALKQIINQNKFFFIVQNTSFSIKSEFFLQKSLLKYDAKIFHCSSTLFQKINLFKNSTALIKYQKLVFQSKVSIIIGTSVNKIILLIQELQKLNQVIFLLIVFFGRILDIEKLKAVEKQKKVVQLSLIDLLLHKKFVKIICTICSGFVTKYLTINEKKYFL